jgi:hypothetical protein
MLHKDVTACFANKTTLKNSLISIENDKGHGRIEKRIAYSFADIAWRQQEYKWPGLNSIGMVSTTVWRMLLVFGMIMPPRTAIFGVNGH